ncbi:HV03 protein, partial [Piaya cayana]|nr:HV03 protein [Piaya cayana]
GLWAQVRLMEAGGGLRAPGDSVVLSCHWTGLPNENYAVWWYRHPPGATLTWLSAMSYDSTRIKYGPSVQGRANVSWDNSQSKAFLSLLDLNHHDSAHYFCAVDTE